MALAALGITNYEIESRETKARLLKRALKGDIKAVTELNSGASTLTYHYRQGEGEWGVPTKNLKEILENDL